jgi:hypothetical protein
MEILGVVVPIAVLYGITKFIIAVYNNWYEIKPTGQYFKKE